MTATGIWLSEQRVQGVIGNFRPRRCNKLRCFVCCSSFSDSTEILTSSPPLTALSTPPPTSSSSSSHKFLRIGRRRGGPFKRSMIPALQSDLSPQQSSSLKIIRKALRKNGSRSEAIPQCSSNQIVTSTDYDSDTSLEILTGEELVESMANKKRTRRSRHKRLTAPTKETPAPAEIPSKIKQTSIGSSRKPGLPLQVGAPEILESSSGQSPHTNEVSGEGSRSKRVKLVTTESSANPTKSKRTAPPPASLPPSPVRKLPAESSEVRVLRHREISISPEKRSKLLLRMVKGSRESIPLRCGAIHIIYDSLLFK